MTCNQSKICDWPHRFKQHIWVPLWQWIIQGLVHQNSTLLHVGLKVESGGSACTGKYDETWNMLGLGTSSKASFCWPIRSLWLGQTCIITQHKHSIPPFCVSTPSATAMAGVLTVFCKRRKKDRKVNYCNARKHKESSDAHPLEAQTYLASPNKSRWKTRLGSKNRAANQMKCKPLHLTMCYMILQEVDTHSTAGRLTMHQRTAFALWSCMSSCSAAGEGAS